MLKIYSINGKKKKKKKKLNFLTSNYTSNFKDVEYKSKIVSHYPQIAWTEATKTGCDIVKCSNDNLLVYKIW